MTDRRGAGGSLRLVGTPIGNLDDLSPRARDALADADVVACEDSRRTGLLLQRVGVGRRPLLVVNEHTEGFRAVEIVDRIREGQTVALVSDAGMPSVSDPGGRVVAAVLDAGLAVDVVPGPTAVTTALVLSGLPTERYVFEGFLPRKGADRRERLAEIAAEKRTVVIYESPRRTAATLADLADVCGPDRPAAVARELTKLHQEVRRGGLADLAAGTADGLRGEVVLVVGPAPPIVRSGEAPSPDEVAAIEAEVGRLIAEGSSRRDASAAVAARRGWPKRVVYEIAVRA